MSKQPTPRMMEVMVNIFCGDQSDAVRTNDRLPPSIEPSDEIPAWGRVDTYAYTRRTHATHRMKQRMAEMGLLEYSEMSRRGTRFARNVLTMKGLNALKGKYPALPDIDRRITERTVVEAEQMRQKIEEDRRLKIERDERAEKFRAEKIKNVRTVLVEFGFDGDTLTDNEAFDLADRLGRL